jgi:membrane protease YdiL (CAAX protease family)
MWLLFVVVYVAIVQGLGLVLGSDLHTNAGTIPNADAILREMTIPIACSMLFAAGFATWLGWWPQIWRDHRPVQRWLRVLPVVLLAASVLACDYANLLDQTAGLVLLLVLTVAMVGFTEELVFRGIGVTAFRRGGLAEGKVALWTSLVFGLVHVSNALSTGGTALVQAAVVSFAGYFFYLVRRWSGGILLAMIVHATWDFALISSQLGPSHAAYGPTLIAPVALVGVGVLVFRRRHRIEPDAGATA